MLNVILYTKEGCGLCEEVKAELAEFTAVYPHHLTEIDITLDRELFARYCYTIPIVHIGEVELQAPITVQELASALKTAVQQPHRPD